VRKDGFFTSPEDSSWNGVAEELGARKKRRKRRLADSHGGGRRRGPREKGGDSRGVEVVVTVSGLEVVTRLISNLAVFHVPFLFRFRSFTVLPSLCHLVFQK
jgi:hypothetical protein